MRLESNVKGPIRGRSLGTKLTELEFAGVEAAAVQAGVGLSEWCRRAVLETVDRGERQTADTVLVAELLALRTVLLNVTFRMASGGALSQEEMRQLIDRADRDKLKRAAALLNPNVNEGS